jgi:hypothetical protein
MIDLDSIFYVCDEFFKIFSEESSKNTIEGAEPLNLTPSPRMTTPEIMTILIAFHTSGFHDLKHFYDYIRIYHRRAFPGLLSYSRFIELTPTAAISLYALSISLRGEHTGNSFVDATALAVCKNKRIYAHKVFKNLARRGKTTMGWFFGFKLHLVINEFGHILAFTLTQGNVDDRVPVPQLLKDITGRVFGDKGYISQPLFEKLFAKGSRLITSLRSNMKPKLHTLSDSQMLGKRSLIESVFNVLKNSCRMEHSRHRSPKNFVVNLIGAVCAYMMRFTLGDDDSARLEATH